MKKGMKSQNFTISTSTILKVIGVVAGLWFLWFIRDVLGIFFVALLLAALIDPLANYFVKFKIPRGVTVLLTYVVLFAVVAGVLLLVVPPLTQQLGEIGQDLDQAVGSVSEVLESVEAFSTKHGLAEGAGGLSNLRENLSQGASQIFTTIADVFGGIASLILVLVLAFYIVVEEDVLKRVARQVVPKKYHAYTASLIGRMQTRLGKWMRGQLLLMLLIGVFTYVGLTILGVRFALVLALLAGLAEMVPYVGPTASSIPAILLAFTISPLKALLVAVLYFAIQQLENGILVPKVMQKTAGLNPIVSLFSVLVGFKLAGVLGALLAIPIATVISVFVQDVMGTEK